jgi:protein TonB
VVAKVAEPGAWRFGRKEENVAGLSWVVAIAASFLLVGIIGLFQKEAPLLITLAGAAGAGAGELASTEVSMAELQALEEAPTVTEQILPPETVDLVQPTEIVPDLPELTEVMPLEDLFTVPAAPRIEDALRPVDPVPKVTPKPQPVASRAAPRRATASTSSSTGASPGSGAAGTGGSGGSGTVGAGAGKGRFPEPTYPSSARSRGVSGRVTLALSISATGVVESAAAISSQGGFTSGEQDTIAGFVRRNWRFPTGTPRRHTVNIVFKLQSR